MHNLSGVLIPAPSPFTDDASALSEIRLARWLRRAADFGGSGFVAGGDAGEFGSLTFSERRQLFDLVLRNAPAGTVVLAHISTLSTAAAIELAMHASDGGAAAALIMPPYYGRFTDAELAAHVQSVAQHGRLPLYVVDPLRRIGPELAEALAQIPEVALARPLAESFATDPACFETETSDEFAAGNLLASPMRALGPLGSQPLGQVVSQLIREQGSARVIKAASELAGLDLGPLRNPARSLPAHALDALREVMRQAA